MLADWSDRFCLNIFCRLRYRKTEVKLGLNKVDSFCSIIFGSRKTVIYQKKKLISYMKIDFLKMPKIMLKSKKSYFHFEDEYISNKLLKNMLCPRVEFIASENEDNCIFVGFHKSLLNLFEHFANYIHENTYIWINIKHILALLNWILII